MVELCGGRLPPLSVGNLFSTTFCIQGPRCWLGYWFLGCKLELSITLCDFISSLKSFHCTILSIINAQGSNLTIPRASWSSDPFQANEIDHTPRMEINWLIQSVQRTQSILPHKQQQKSKALGLRLWTSGLQQPQTAKPQSKQSQLANTMASL